MLLDVLLKELIQRKKCSAPNFPYLKNQSPKKEKKELLTRRTT
jgi:hypothetical protein